MKTILCVLVLLMFMGPSSALPAFPGAEGMGADSIGGRGGTVFIVSNLNDNGTGSFRNATNFSGSRIIVFNVSGIIHLSSPLEIIEPNVTIAGETSPGGILIAGYPTRIKTNDVILTHMRFRNGCDKCYASGNCDDTGDSLSVYGYPTPYGGDHRLDAYNIIIDHCSVSWGCDETFDFAAETARVDNITVSNCLIAEGVNDAHSEANHARGLFMWGKHTLPGETIRVSFHDNLVMSFYTRLPLANYNVSFDFVNNVVYNFNSIYSPTLEPLTGYTVTTNMINNYIKPGPNSLPAYPTGVGREMVVHGDGGNGHMSGDPYEMIYMSGCFGYTRDNLSGGDWIVSEGWSPTNLLNESYKRSTPFPSPGGIDITIETMSVGLASSIVNSSGANKPSSDSVDIRLMNEYHNGTIGDYIGMADVVFPTFQTPSPPTDNDQDGMADSWETDNGLNTSLDDSALDENGNGYSNIEDYLHYLADYTADFTIDHTKVYYNTTSPIENVVNSTGYNLWNRTPTSLDSECNFNLEVTI